jgi:hypothetical protein
MKAMENTEGAPNQVQSSDERDDLSGDITPRLADLMQQIAAAENEPDAEVNFHPPKFSVERVHTFDRADGFRMYHRSAWCNECADEYGLEIVSRFVARTEDSALDFPEMLKAAIKICRDQQTGLMVAELSCISSNPEVIFRVYDMLRSPTPELPKGVPLIVCGYGMIAYTVKRPFPGM